MAIEAGRNGRPNGSLGRFRILQPGSRHYRIERGTLVRRIAGLKWTGPYQAQFKIGPSRPRPDCIGVGLDKRLVGGLRKRSVKREQVPHEDTFELRGVSAASGGL